MQHPVRGHGFETEGLTGKRPVCVRPIGMFRAGACSVGVEETMTCDELPGMADGLETRRKGRGDLFITGAAQGLAVALAGLGLFWI